MKNEFFHRFQKDNVWYVWYTDNERSFLLFDFLTISQFFIYHEIQFKSDIKKNTHIKYNFGMYIILIDKRSIRRYIILLILFYPSCWAIDRIVLLTGFFLSRNNFGLLPSSQRDWNQQTKGERERERGAVGKAIKCMESCKAWLSTLTPADSRSNKSRRPFFLPRHILCTYATYAVYT